MKLAATISLLAALALGSAAVSAAPPVPTVTPGELTVGVSLPSEGFEVGVAKGDQVIYAQGFDIDLARALAKRLGLARVAFVQSQFGRLYSGGAKPWDVAIAQITITDQRRQTADFSQPYMSVDQGVLAAQTVKPAPGTLADLRSLRICALAKSTGADVAGTTIAPTTPVRLIGNVPTLMLNLQTGRCQAVVYDAPTLGTLKARAPDRYGPLVGVIKTGEQYGVALPKGSQLLTPVDTALAALMADGTVQRLQQKWLSANLSTLPVLR
jgi:polar amino acid transport system substrate-binding protein